MAAEPAPPGDLQSRVLQAACHVWQAAQLVAPFLSPLARPRQALNACYERYKDPISWAMWVFYLLVFPWVLAPWLGDKGYYATAGLAEWSLGHAVAGKELAAALDPHTKVLLASSPLFMLACNKLFGGGVSDFFLLKKLPWRVLCGLVFKDLVETSGRSGFMVFYLIVAVAKIVVCVTSSSDAEPAVDEDAASEADGANEEAQAPVGGADGEAPAPAAVGGADAERARAPVGGGAEIDDAAAPAQAPVGGADGEARAPAPVGGADEVRDALEAVDRLEARTARLEAMLAPLIAQAPADACEIHRLRVENARLRAAGRGGSEPPTPPPVGLPRRADAASQASPEDLMRFSPQTEDEGAEETKAGPIESESNSGFDSDSQPLLGGSPTCSPS